MSSSTNSGRTLFVCCAVSFAICNKFTRPTPPVTFSFDRANGRHTGACTVLASLLTSNSALTFPVSGAHPSAYPMSRKVWGILRSRCCRALATVVIRAARSSMAGCPAQYVGLCLSLSTAIAVPFCDRSLSSGCVVYCARCQLSIHSTQHDESTSDHVALSAAAA